MTLIPEEPFDIDEVVRRARIVATRAVDFASIVVVAEGAVPVEGTFELAGDEVDRSATCASAASATVGRGDRGPHRVRDAGHDPGPRAARRHADGLRPGAGDPLRHRRHRRRRRRATGGRWWRCRRTRSCRCPSPTPSVAAKTVDLDLLRRGSPARSSPPERPVGPWFRAALIPPKPSVAAPCQFGPTTDADPGRVVRELSVEHRLGGREQVREVARADPDLIAAIGRASR